MEREVDVRSIYIDDFCSLFQGTLIIPNLSSVLKEEGQWKCPHEFHPDNFLNENGEFVKPEAFVPFSTGETRVDLRGDGN